MIKQQPFGWSYSVTEQLHNNARLEFSGEVYTREAAREQVRVAKAAMSLVKEVYKKGRRP